MNIIKYVIIYLLAIPFFSCKKDFLNVTNTQNPVRETYVKDLASMQEYLKGIYYRLTTNFEATGDLGSYADLAADNLRPFSVTVATSGKPIYNWAQANIADQNMDVLWLESYTTIRMCSFVINEIDKYKSENSVKANDLKGQALAIRSLLHFKLVNVFAQSYNYTAGASHPGVPFITTDDITKLYSRHTVAEVYAGIIDDLNNAIQLLPTTITDIRYMNINAAKALLARAYLFKEDYLQAKSLALDVANKVPLMTIATGYPTDIYKLKSPSTTESLFQLTPHSQSRFLGRFVRRIGTLYFFVPTNDIASILTENNNDVRQSWITKMSGVSGAPDTLTVTKFPTGVASGIVPAVTIPENAYYPALLRSSEMFLTVAEACAKTSDETTARIYLNAVRKRANPAIVDVTATGPALLDSIYKERRKELAFENLRMFDLLRWKKGVNRIDVLSGSPTTLPYPADRAISPIPDIEIRLSGFPQNSSY